MRREEFTLGKRVRLVRDRACVPRVPVGSVGVVVEEANDLTSPPFVREAGRVAFDGGTVSYVEHGDVDPADP